MEGLRKFNCWEYMKCGREPSGDLVDNFGVCPASVERTLDNIHDGNNGGRACWIIAGSSQGHEKIECVFAKVHKGCENCDFYHIVQEEEGPSFLDKGELLRRLSPE